MPMMNHRPSVWAEEQKAPKEGEIIQEDTVGKTRANRASGTGSSKPADDILIVASKLKSYIKGRGDMNTSSDVMEMLSHAVRRLADDAIDNARADGRRTVKGRDIRFR